LYAGNTVCCHILVDCRRSIRVFVRSDVLFIRELENGDIMRVPGYFGTTPVGYGAVTHIP